jgi:hypothetical protein
VRRFPELRDPRHFATDNRAAIATMRRTAALLRTMCSWGRHLTCAQAGVTDLTASTSYCQAGAAHGPAQQTWSSANSSSSSWGWGQLAHQPTMCWRGLAHSRWVHGVAVLHHTSRRRCVCMPPAQSEQAVSCCSILQPPQCVSACTGLSSRTWGARHTHPSRVRKGEQHTPLGHCLCPEMGGDSRMTRVVAFTPHRQKPSGPPQPAPRKAPQRSKRPQLPHNEQITAPSLRVVTPEGTSSVLSLQEARAAAAHHQMDLVLIRWVCQPGACVLSEIREACALTGTQQDPLVQFGKVQAGLGGTVVGTRRYPCGCGSAAVQKLQTVLVHLSV